MTRRLYYLRRGEAQARPRVWPTRPVSAPLGHPDLPLVRRSAGCPPSAVPPLRVARWRDA